MRHTPQVDTERRLHKMLRRVKPAHVLFSLAAAFAVATVLTINTGVWVWIIPLPGVLWAITCGLAAAGVAEQFRAQEK